MSAIARDTVVSVRVELSDAQNRPLHPGETLTYLHGGYGGLLAALERVLEGHTAGEIVRVHLEPEHAFGEYDAQLLRVEPQARYGEGLRVGMEVEDAFEGGSPRRYTVTDLAAGKVVLDGNHPLAGIALHVTCTVLAVRAASAEERERGTPDLR